MRLSVLRSFALLILVSAWPAQAGYYYQATTVTETEGKRKTEAMTVEAWIEGEKAKVVFKESDNPLTPTGSYLLTTDGGKTVFLVDPNKKTYTEWDVAAMMRMAGEIMNSLGGVMNLEFSSPEAETLLEEDGGELLGYPTRHYRFRTSYDMTMKMLGMKRNMTIDTLQDVWATDAIDDAAFGVWLRADQSATGNEGLDRIIRAEMDKMRGFPLKTVTESTTLTQKQKKKGKPGQVSRTVTEVKMLREEAVPAATFELDPGYERTESPLSAANG